MLIRNAVEADLPAIVAIYNDTIPSRKVTGDTEPVSVQSRLPWFHQHTPHHRPLWVMDMDGAIAGWLGFQSFYGRPAYEATAEISIYIAAAYRRQGIGRRLLSQAIEFCPALNIKTLLGFIFADNEPSMRLFKAMDFQTWGYLPQVAEFDGGIERDLVIVGRRVRDGETKSEKLSCLQRVEVVVTDHNEGASAVR